MTDNKLQFYGQFEYKLDNYLYNTFFSDTYDGVSIEAGASDGVTDNTTKFFEAHMKWKTINVEPLSEWYNKCVINRPSSVNINKALHPYYTDKDVTFSVPVIPTHGTLNHLGSLNEAHVRKYNTKIYTETVRTITYNRLIEDNNVQRLDLFVLDIEGYEIIFLETFPEWKVLPNVFVIEVGHLNEDEITNMISSKYVLYDKQYVNNIYVLRDWLNAYHSAQISNHLR